MATIKYKVVSKKQGYRYLIYAGKKMIIAKGVKFYKNEVECADAARVMIDTNFGSNFTNSSKGAFFNE